MNDDKDERRSMGEVPRWNLNPASETKAPQKYVDCSSRKQMNSTSYGVYTAAMQVFNDLLGLLCRVLRLKFLI